MKNRRLCSAILCGALAVNMACVTVSAAEPAQTVSPVTVTEEESAQIAELEKALEEFAATYGSDQESIRKVVYESILGEEGAQKLLEEKQNDTIFERGAKVVQEFLDNLKDEVKKVLNSQTLLPFV